MSANSIKQERIAARESKENRKREAEEVQAKVRRRNRIGWIIGIGLFVLLIVFGILNTKGLLPALRVNDRTYSTREVSYYYANEYWQFVNNYGSFASYMGLDTSAGISSLGSQAYTASEDYATWREYFLSGAKSTMASLQALDDYARENGLSLTEEEIAAVDADLDTLEQNVIAGGYKNLDLYFSTAYGSGVNRKIAREAALLQARASKAYDHATAQFEYTDEELSDYYDSLEGETDKYDYWYYYVAADKVDSEPDADGNVTSDVTEETMAAAKEKADAIVAAFKAGSNNEESLNSALTEVLPGALCTARKNTTASSVTDDYKDWVIDPSRTEGDIAALLNSTETGYYVVVFGRHDDNHYPTVSVRHILIKAVADEDGNYSDQALEEARVKAEGVYTQWKNGDATEESFAALAAEYSEDDGSKANGGLYENIYKGQMVENFDAFCFADHKPGDTDMVSAVSSNYAGYHIIYYVGEGELYSNYIARIRKSSEDTEAWYSALTENYSSKELLGFGLAGK
jgi:parvulin-like peptidyl-prolyl isomerase